MASQTHKFPSHIIDPKKKDEKWCLKYIKAAHSNYISSTGENSIYARRNDWIENRKYAEGNQTTEKYEKWLSKLKGEGNKTVSYMDLDHSIVKVVPKYRDIVLSFMEKVDYDIKITDIDPTASDERENTKWNIWATKLLKPFKDQIDLMTQSGQPIDEENLPETIEELELFMDMKFELKQEISAKVGVNGVLYENEWREVSKLMREDAFDNAVMACKVYDQPNGRIGISYVDPVNVLIENFRGHRTDKIERIGEYRQITLQQLKQESKGKFSDDDYEKMFYKFKNSSFNSGFSNSEFINTDEDSLNSYESCKVNVLDLYWFSLDKKKSKKKKVHGNEYVYKESFEKKTGKRKNYEVFETDTKTVYKGSWIVGTDFIYNSGKQNNIPRLSDNPRECMLPIKFYRIANTSSLERMLPFADAIQLSWLKIQNAKARAMPKGFTVYQEAFENVTIDGKEMSVKELMEIAVQTGWKIVSRENSIDGNGNSIQPLIPDEGGLGNEFIELVGDITYNINMIKDVTGINDFMDAGNPGERALVGIGKIAVEGTKNAIHPMVSAYSYIKEKTCLDIISRLQQKAKHGRMKFTYPELGNGIAKTFEIGNEINGGKFNLRLEQRSSPEQRELIKQATGQALAKSDAGSPGGISLDDYLHIIDLIDQGYLRLAETTLSYRIKRKMKADQKRAEANSRTQGEQQQELTKVAADEERKTKEFDADLEIKKEEKLSAIRIKEEEEKAKIKAKYEDNQ